MMNSETHLPQLWTLPGHGHLPEPLLSFHAQHEAVHEHPLNGLLEFGPFSSSLYLAPLGQVIRVATICPRVLKSRVQVLIRELTARQVPRERRTYLPIFEGFERVFKLPLTLASDSYHIELPVDLAGELRQHPKPYLLLADTLKRCVQTLVAQRTQWDVLLVALPEEWRDFCLAPADEEFDLHDFLKLVCAANSIPLQMTLGESIFTYRCRASVAWRLSIALYCKAGGIPWKLANVEPETAYIGMGYAMRSKKSAVHSPDHEASERFVTCCSQVFDAEGTGLEFIAYNASMRDITIEGDNPYLSRAQMLSVVSRSLDLYRRQHAGEAPRRVIIHKTTPFKEEEIEGCFDAWARDDGLDLIQVQQDVSWCGIHFERDQEGRPVTGGYPCPRGVYLPISGYDVLLWTQGDVPQVDGRHFYKEGKGIPHPLLLTRFAGRGRWEGACRVVLDLTKMNWNNDSLYDRLPVTLSYASTLARVFKSVAAPSTGPYQFRFFM